MNCETCKLPAHHIVTTSAGERCENCGGFSVSHGTKMSGSMTRGSFRIRQQQSRYEGDMVQPHVWDSSSKRHRVNPDFIRLYADKAKDIFTEQEMVASGYTKLPAHSRKLKAQAAAKVKRVKQDVTYEGSAEKAAKRIIGDAQ